MLKLCTPHQLETSIQKRLLGVASGMRLGCEQLLHCLLLVVLALIVVRVSADAGTFEFDAQSYTLQEDAGTGQVTIVRTGGVSGSVIVEFALAKPLDATATANKNFKLTDAVREVSFDENQLVGFINIELINDAEYEANEFFFLEITSVSSSAEIGANSTAVVYISDDGDAGQFNFAVPYIFCREDSGNAIVTINRSIGFSSASYVPVTLVVTTVGADSNATQGGSKAFDYLGISQELKWATDEVSKTFAVKIFNNNKYEPDSRAIKVRLDSVKGGATIGDNADMWIYIIDDRDAGTLSFDLSHYSVLENGGKVTVNVTRSGTPDATNVNTYTDGTVTVDIATYSGTILPGKSKYDPDYDYGVVEARGCTHISPCTAEASIAYTPIQTTTLTFADKEAWKTIDISILDNDLFQSPDQVFKVALENVGGGAHIGVDFKHPNEWSWYHDEFLALEVHSDELMDNIGTIVTIQDDGDPAVIVTKASLSVSEIGQVDTFHVRLNSPPTSDVTIQLAVTATELEVSSSSLTFSSGNWDTEQKVTVQAIADDTADGIHSSVITIAVSSSDTSYSPPLKTKTSSAGYTLAVGIYTQKWGTYDTGNAEHAFSWAEDNGVLTSPASQSSIKAFIFDDDQHVLKMIPEAVRHKKTGSKPSNFVCVRENGHDASVEVTLLSEPHSDVDISFVVETDSNIQVDPESIHFTPTSWGDTQRIKVSAITPASPQEISEVQFFKLSAYSASRDAMYNQGDQPVGGLFVQRFPTAVVLLDSSRATSKENGGDESVVSYELQLGSEPMHWEPEGAEYEPFKLTLQPNADTSLIFSEDSTVPLGSYTSLVAASNSTQSTSEKTVKSVAVVRFNIFPTIQTETGSTQVGFAVLRLFRISGGENGGLGGIVVGVTTAERDASDAWNEDLLTTQCKHVDSGQSVPECFLAESGSAVSSLFPSSTTFSDVSVQTDGEALISQSKEINPKTNEFVASSGWIEIDVTTAVNRALAQQRDYPSSSTSISFLVYSRSIAPFVYDGVDEVTFASKEYIDTTAHPHLQITASGRVNLALSGAASQSQYGNANAAIDGKVYSDSGIASTYAMSRSVDTYPWWQLDLGSIRRIEDVVVTIKKKVPIADLLQNQLPATFWVFLSNTPFPESSNETEDFMSTKENALYWREFEVSSRSFDALEVDTITYQWRVNGEKNGFFEEDRFIANYTVPTEAQYFRFQIEGGNSILLNEVEIYQQAFASTRISVGGYIPSVASASAKQNQIELLIPSMHGANSSPCDDTTRICRHELIFTSGNWRDSQQVQVRVIDDKVATGDREVMVTHTAESLDFDYYGNSFCDGSQNDCSDHLFNDSSVKKLLILEDDENKVILSKSKFLVTEGSHAYPGATPFYKLSGLQARYIRCSNDPTIVIDMNVNCSAACTASFNSSIAPWETCITNKNALPLEAGSAWIMAGFESVTSISAVTFVVPALTGVKYVREISLWGNPDTSITSASADILNISKNWIEVTKVQLPMKSGGPQTITMDIPSAFAVRTFLILFDKSYDANNGCILAPQVSITGYTPVPFPLPVRGDLTSPDSVPPVISHLSRMHLFGEPDSVSIRLSSEPLADTLVSVLVEDDSTGVTTFDATNASSSLDSLSNLIGAKYESGSTRHYRMPTTLRFTPETWNVAQVLTFLAVDDNTYLGNRTLSMHVSSLITDTDGLTVPSQSVDTGTILRTNVHLSTSLSYSNAEFVVSDHQDDKWPFHIVPKWKSASGLIEVAIVDDDLPGVTISTSDAITSESSSKTNFSITLDSAPLQDVTIKISYKQDASLFSVTPLEFTFTRLNWYEPQRVDVSPVSNDIYDGAFPFTLYYERLIPKANQPILLHKVTSLDDTYDGLEVGTNENKLLVSYAANQGVRVTIEDDDTGCEKEYDCLNDGVCHKSSAGNVCLCPPTFGMKNCSLVCEQESECAFDRVSFNIRCLEGESEAVCSSTFTAKRLTSVLYRMLTLKAFTSVDGQSHPKLSLYPVSEAMYVVNSSRAACVDGSEGCVVVSVDFMRPNLDDTSITTKLLAYQEAGSLKVSPMHIELMSMDPQYVQSKSAMIGVWIFVGLCGAALTGAAGLFTARAINTKTSHVIPQNVMLGEETELLAVGATSPREGNMLPFSTST